MAGHSKWSSIKHKKKAKDEKKAKMFTKLLRVVTVSVKEGGDNIVMNRKLEKAVYDAKKIGVPKEQIDKAIKKAAGKTDSENFENIRYEGYGPSGSAIMVECLTDNRNRTASDIRFIFSKNDGNLGETGCVTFLFDKLGYIIYNISSASEEEILETAINLGAVSCDTYDEYHEIITDVSNFSEVRSGLIEKFGDPEKAEIEWMAKDKCDIKEEAKEKVSKLIDMLEDNDDVQTVSCNINLE